MMTIKDQLEQELNEVEAAIRLFSSKKPVFVQPTGDSEENSLVNRSNFE